MIRRPPRSTQSRSSAASDVYKRQVRKRYVGQRQRAGPGHGARHVGYAIVNDPAHFVNRLAVRGRFRRFETPALIDRDIHHHGAWPHRTNHVASHELRRYLAWNQDAADNEIGVTYRLCHIMTIG